jgi:hypothetical protein
MTKTMPGTDEFNEMDAYVTDTNALLKQFHEMLERS